jgi:hypothetical protein
VAPIADGIDKKTIDFCSSTKVIREKLTVDSKTDGEGPFQIGLENGNRLNVIEIEPLPQDS